MYTFEHFTFSTHVLVDIKSSINYLHITVSPFYNPESSKTLLCPGVLRAYHLMHATCVMHKESPRKHFQIFNRIWVQSRCHNQRSVSIQSYYWVTIFMIFAVGPRKSLLPVWSDWRDHGCLCCHLKPPIWCPPGVSGQTRFSSLFDDMTSLSNVCAGEMSLVQLIQLSCGLPEIRYQMIKDVHLTVWKEITYIFILLMLKWNKPYIIHADNIDTECVHVLQLHFSLKQ